MYFLTLLLVHFAVFAQANKDLRNYAVIRNIGSGASLGDCINSLLHENSLGQQHLVSHKVFDDKFAICRNRESTNCDANTSGWTIQGCAQRIVAQYKNGQAPPYNMGFGNSHGDCLYRPYAEYAAGIVVNNFDICPCKAVGVTIGESQCQ